MCLSSPAWPGWRPRPSLLWCRPQLELEPHSRLRLSQNIAWRKKKCHLWLGFPSSFHKHRRNHLHLGDPGLQSEPSPGIKCQIQFYKILKKIKKLLSLNHLRVDDLFGFLLVPEISKEHIPSSCADLSHSTINGRWKRYFFAGFQMAILLHHHHILNNAI